LILRGGGGVIGFGIKYADHRKLKLNLALSGENKINVMFIRIRYYDAKKINILASKSCKNKYSDPNKTGNNLTEKMFQCCFHFNSPGKWPV
jgi:uncharacterized membrane protein (Fun14 family)